MIENSIKSEKDNNFKVIIFPIRAWSSQYGRDKNEFVVKELSKNICITFLLVRKRKFIN